MRYRTRPEYVDAFRVVEGTDLALPIWAVEAMKLTGGTPGAIVATMEENDAKPAQLIGYTVYGDEGMHAASVGDWILRDEDQRLHVMPDDMFTETFEPVPVEDSSTSRAEFEAVMHLRERGDMSWPGNGATDVMSENASGLTLGNGEPQGLRIGASDQGGEAAHDAKLARAGAGRMLGAGAQLGGAAARAPAIGTIVYFYSGNPGLLGLGEGEVGPVPAVITRLGAFKGRVDLTVFRVGLEPVAVRDVPFSNEGFPPGEGAAWCWPTLG
jgi:hypothetical protein